LDVEKEGRIMFLDMEIKKTKDNRKIKTTWDEKELNEGIFCNEGSDEVDDGTNKNLIIKWKEK
jgi:hypothetical protein